MSTAILVMLLVAVFVLSILIVRAIAAVLACIGWASMRDTHPPEMFESLEPRTMASASVSTAPRQLVAAASASAVIMVTPFNVNFTPPRIMKPGATETGQVASKTTAPGHTKQPAPQPPTITPVLPTFTVINLADPTDIAPMTVPVNATLWGTWNGDGITPMPGSMPSYRDIRQGGYGDCWLLGGVEGIVLQSPGDLVGMLTLAGDGGYLIQPRGGNIIYHMTGTLHSYGAQFGPDFALYPMVFEKFFAIVYGSELYKNLSGGWMSTVGQYLGLPYSSFLTPSSDVQLARNLDAAHAAGLSVTFGSGSYPIDGAPIVGNHCYVLVSYTLHDDGSYTFHVVQPWGAEYALDITYQNIVNDFYFAGVQIARQRMGPPIVSDSPAAVAAASRFNGSPIWAM
jgi:hypothetical protein